jgi:hypothetical protein
MKVPEWPIRVVRLEKTERLRGCVWRGEWSGVFGGR